MNKVLDNLLRILRIDSLTYAESNENKAIFRRKKVDLELTLYIENNRVMGNVKGCGFDILSVPDTFAVAAYKTRVLQFDPS